MTTLLGSADMKHLFQLRAVFDGAAIDNTDQIPGRYTWSCKHLIRANFMECSQSAWHYFNCFTYVILFNLHMVY